MAWPALIAALLVQPLPVLSSPVGTYRVDLRNVPKASKSPLQAVFGRSPVRISKDGTFVISGIRQSGFWRLHGDRLVAINSGFMGVPFAIPDDVLKRSWPSNHLEGLVFDQPKEGILRLSRFGRVEGPIPFIREPSKSTLTLLEESRVDDEISAVAAFSELMDEMPTRWRELRKAINDPKVTPELRMWAAGVWNGPVEDSVIDAMLATVRDLKTEGLNERQARAIRGTLCREISGICSKKHVPELQKLHEKGFMGKTTLARAITRTKDDRYASLLKDWLSATGAYERAGACEGLAALREPDALELIRPLAQDPEPVARIAALSSILQLSADKEERTRSINALAAELKGEWLNASDAVDALGDSKSPEAVRPLIAILATGSNMFVKRDAATALGKLGFPEAIPALLEAKEGKRFAWAREMGEDPSALETFFSSRVEDADVRKAAAEALWKFDQRRAQVANRLEIGWSEMPDSRFCRALRVAVGLIRSQAHPSSHPPKPPSHPPEKAR